VLPGAIDDPRYEGSNRLLKDGAVLVTGAQDVLQIFPDLSASAPASARAIARLSPELSLRAEPLFVLLDEERFTPYESLLDRWDSPWPLDQLLVELEIEGAIERHPGNQFSRP
jgi:DNA processing protein